MGQRRNRRASVEDRWRKSDGTESANNGKGKRWRARYVDDAGVEHARAFARKVDAQQWLDEVTASLTAGTYVAPRAGEATIGELRKQWSSAQGHIKETTAATRQFTWNMHVDPRWATVAVRDVQTTTVRAWVQTLKDEGCRAETIENALGVLRMICTMAVEDRRIPRNPCDGVKAPRREHRARGYLNHEQVELLANCTPTSADATVVRFLAYTGLRWGEMVSTASLMSPLVAR